MSDKSYKDGKRAYSSNSKLMKAFYKKEYLEQLEQEKNTSNYTKKINTNNHCSIVKKFFITLFILLLIIGIVRRHILYAICKKSY